MIKPSSPTPDHLRELKFSCLDQFIGPFHYTNLIFFYQADAAAADDDENGYKSQALKQSLSEILTVFYPLAGQVVLEGNSSINCNDNGVAFVEAKVLDGRQLSDMIEEPNLEELKHFLPTQHFVVEDNIVLLLQVSFFDCGGIAVGFSFLHKVGDGKSMGEFMTAWANANKYKCNKCKCRCDDQFMNNFNLASLFPPVEFLRTTSLPSTTNLSEKFVTKRLILDRKKLTDLKEAIVSAPGSQLKDPTRVEAASAFIWKHYIIDSAAQKRRQIKLQPNVDQVEVVVENAFMAQHTVDARTRMNPPETNVFGNCFLIAATEIVNYNDQQQEMHHLAYLLRKAIKKIDGDYIKQVQIEGERYFTNLFQRLDPVLKGKLGLCSFSSWCRLPFYEVDYGWGKPLWVCTTPIPLKNLVVFISTPSGDGIEAWINMLEDDMKIIRIE
ncbi:hypothetical protein RD792_006469 [Penstemon davidsonii]|uniref:Uncharacterized protein n=1 Tax=Penstemon davidsonii TaxID=160366 RepID=A0ABR0DDP3_9LAMI|nr:hypothetical protein RD792_006469 [Penstemon davidsonii]